MKCHGIRLQAFWLFWLMEHRGRAGRMIEEALEAHFRPDIDEMIKGYYEKRCDDA
jgi:hypothetical protein